MPMDGWEMLVKVLHTCLMVGRTRIESNEEWPVGIGSTLWYVVGGLLDLQQNVWGCLEWVPCGICVTPTHIPHGIHSKHTHTVWVCLEWVGQPR